MIRHNDINRQELHKQLRQKKIQLGGNTRLKIYGTLHCKSGKRMKKENRVFFSSEKEAISNGYRPCGHCMKQAYLKWKN
ncbi:MAG: metal-binding protein [Sphingobacteriales bacterium]|nr:metal-binding protein [Sphingobacteriales bacterium]MBI3719813.1 metal-binding protein [Sphingobacteriales bacterium]